MKSTIAGVDLAKDKKWTDLFFSCLMGDGARYWEE